MPELVEFFKLHMQLTDAHTLRTFVSGTANTTPQLVEACHLMATDEQCDMHQMHTTAASISSGQRRLRQGARMYILDPVGGCCSSHFC